jgi:DNA-binding transcriptional regulator YiaG
MLQTTEITHFSTFSAADPAVLSRLASGRIEGSEDVVALRRFVGLTQKQFATAIGISVHTLRNWEQGRRSPDGPAVALLRIAARHPRIIRENAGAPDMPEPPAAIAV